MRPGPYDNDDAFERRRTVIRSALVLVIVATIPFHLLGFFLWASAPADDAGRTPLEATLPNDGATNTPLGGDVTATNTRQPTRTLVPSPGIPTVRPIVPGPQPPLIPTNPGIVPVLPTPTTGPTLTPRPTDPPPIVQTPLPPPTDTPPPPPTQDPEETFEVLPPG